MHDVFQKLQFKNHDKIYVLGAPPEFRPILDSMSEYTLVKKSPMCKQEYEFALFFVKQSQDIAKYAEKASAKVPGDGLLWFAYPKKSSKKYQTDISRDHGWQPLGDLGFEAVRQVAIDENWSALRFRHVSFIKTLRRDRELRMSQEGKKRKTT